MSDTIRKIEEHYNVRHMGFYDIPGRDGIDVFYQENPRRDLGHSNYMGFFYHPVTAIPYVCNAATIEAATYPAIRIGDQFLVSRFRHDYKTHECGAMIDGGLDYQRINPNFPITHNMVIIDGQEIFLPVSIQNRTVAERLVARSGEERADVVLSEPTVRHGERGTDHAGVSPQDFWSMY